MYADQKFLNFEPLDNTSFKSIVQSHEGSGILLGHWYIFSYLINKNYNPETKPLCITHIKHVVSRQ